MNTAVLFKELSREIVTGSLATTGSHLIKLGHGIFDTSGLVKTDVRIGAFGNVSDHRGFLT